jgi:dienelactone hydrolase
VSNRSERRRARHRRHLVGLGVVVAVTATTVALVTVLSGSSGRSGRADVSASPTSSVASTTSAPPTTAAPTTTAVTIPPTTTAPPPIAVDRTYAVGVRTYTFVDSSRTTSANGSFPGASTRTLPTVVYYPVPGDPGGSAQDDAAPDRADGPYPLVLFAHGYDVTPAYYAALLQRWAAAGYVVAAPTFPILSGSPGGASHVDYEKTFGDASFVIGSVVTLGGADPLAGIVDGRRIAAAGHSDGEVIAFGLGFLACCRDARVRSVIAMAGNLANANNPSLRDTGTPILHIMEDHDEYDSYADSIAWDRENLTAPRWMLSLVNASHVPPYTQPGNPHFELVSQATIDFLDGTLKGRPDRLDRVTADVAARADLADLER